MAFFISKDANKDADEAVDDAAKARRMLPTRMLAMLATFRTRGH